MNLELRAHGATITSSSTYSGHFNCSTFNSRSIRSRWESFGRNLRVQSHPPGLILAKFHLLSACSSCSQSLRRHHFRPRCEHVRSKLSGNFLFARQPTQNRRRAFMLPLVCASAPFLHLRVRRRSYGKSAATVTIGGNRFCAPVRRNADRSAGNPL